MTGGRRLAPGAGPCKHPGMVTRSLRRLCALAAVALALAGCGRGEDAVNAKRSPRPPAPPRVEVPAELRIAVVVDGQPSSPIAAATLEQLAPDFADSERRAWKLDRLVPALAGAGASVEAVGKAGISVRFAAAADGKVPVVFLTRRGEVVVTVVDPAQPFPEYHGQGGRLGRPGDPVPHVGRVVELRVATR